MPKLHLKRTPAEEEERARKKVKKAHKKAQKHLRSSERSSSPRRRKYYDDDLSEGEAGPSRPQPHSGPHEAWDPDTERARHEQEEFDAKMRDALEDDAMFDPMQRLDGVEARLNSYAHIPRRWTGTDEGFGSGLWMEDALEEIGLQPWQMNDDEYSEYIRAGMWRKKNKAEYQERLRRKEEREARRERDRRIREETRRLHNESRARRAERDIETAETEKRKLVESRHAYDHNWVRLLEQSSDSNSLLFKDIPWPLSSKPSSLSIDSFTRESITSFLLTIPLETNPSPKDIIRSSLLRFHPDKFTSRILARVREEDVDRTREAANVVVRVLNDMAKDHR